MTNQLSLRISGAPRLSDSFARLPAEIARSLFKEENQGTPMQTVLITGGAGFIGQNVVHAWHTARPADRLVVVDAITYAANVRSLEPLISARSISFVRGDIKDDGLMRRLFQDHEFTRVVHLAAESHVDR